MGEADFLAKGIALITDQGGPFKFEFAGGFFHFLLQFAEHGEVVEIPAGFADHGAIRFRDRAAVFTNPPMAARPGPG